MKYFHNLGGGKQFSYVSFMNFMKSINSMMLSDNKELTLSRRILTQFLLDLNLAQIDGNPIGLLAKQWEN